LEDHEAARIVCSHVIVCTHIRQSCWRVHISVRCGVTRGVCSWDGSTLRDSVDANCGSAATTLQPEQLIAETKHVLEDAVKLLSPQRPANRPAATSLPASSREAEGMYLLEPVTAHKHLSVVLWSLQRKSSSWAIIY